MMQRKLRDSLMVISEKRRLVKDNAYLILSYLGGACVDTDSGFGRTAAVVGLTGVYGTTDTPVASVAELTFTLVDSR